MLSEKRVKFLVLNLLSRMVMVGSRVIEVLPILGTLTSLVFSRDISKVRVIL
jgi:hypothetical protein